jgi:quinol monooxygenase YgiN
MAGLHNPVIIVAGHLLTRPEHRDAYLDAVAHVAAMARNAPGCLDFVQAADPSDPARIHIYERWETDEDLERFRAMPSPAADGEVPEIVGGQVDRFRVSAVEPA